MWTICQIIFLKKSYICISEFNLCFCFFLCFCRQYAAAQQDLLEALRLAPKNRELQRLLTRVKEECREQMARYESGQYGAPDLMDRISEDEDDSLAFDPRLLASQGSSSGGLASSGDLGDGASREGIHQSPDETPL